MSILPRALPLILLVAAGQAAADNAPPSQVSGIVRVIHGDDLLIATRTGASLRVNAAEAVHLGRVANLKIGRAVTAVGTRSSAGILNATEIGRAKPSALAWPADR